MAAAHGSSGRISSGTRRSTRRVGQGVAIRTLVYPTAAGNAVLTGRFSRRTVAEAEQPESGNASQNPSGVSAPLSCLSVHTRGGEYLYGDLPACSTFGAVLSPDSSQLAGGM